MCLCFHTNALTAVISNIVEMLFFFLKVTTGKYCQSSSFEGHCIHIRMPRWPFNSAILTKNFRSTFSFTKSLLLTQPSKPRMCKESKCSNTNAQINKYKWLNKQIQMLQCKITNAHMYNQVQMLEYTHEHGYIQRYNC